VVGRDGIESPTLRFQPVRRIQISPAWFARVAYALVSKGPSELIIQSNTSSCDSVQISWAGCWQNHSHAAVGLGIEPRWPDTRFRRDTRGGGRGSLSAAAKHGCDAVCDFSEFYTAAQHGPWLHPRSCLSTDRQSATITAERTSLLGNSNNVNR
jgi:hypothetical protein